jgi:hypothetical protein
LTVFGEMADNNEANVLLYKLIESWTADGSVCWSIKETAKRTSISEQKAYELSRQGVIPTVDWGGRKLVPIHMLLETLTLSCQKKEDGNAKY